MVKEDTVMRKKSFMVLGLTVAMSLSLPLLSYAGEWKEDNIGKWYQNDDGTYPVSQWKWIEFNNGGLELCYYFNESGYLVVNATTPDNYIVNENGAWIENGLIMTRPVGSGEQIPNTTNEQTTRQDMEDLQNSVDDYTYKQSYERTREFVRLQVQKQKEVGNPDFMDITEEYINNASYEELDQLYIKVMRTVGFER